MELSENEVNMPEHHTQTKQRLRQLLQTGGRVATTATLAKRGLLASATALRLPQVQLDVRTRVTQSDSTRRLTFVALEEELLHQPSRDLMHAAAMTEALAQYPGLVPAGYEWRLVDSTERRQLGPGHRPDAELLSPDLNGYRQDIAVEFDAGYSPKTIKAKLRVYAESGYRDIIWMTSIHGRVASVQQMASSLGEMGKLDGVQRVTTVWSDFWSEADRYGHRPRCHKPNVAHVHL